MTPIRLYVDAALAAGVAVEASVAQAHHLGAVMRRGAGDPVRLFNGRDGEWSGRIAAVARGKATLLAETLVRPQLDEGVDLWLVFALLKRDSTDLVVQKATELGVAALIPVFTERTNAARVNADRLQAIATEAAEQSERLTVPVIRPALPLDQVLGGWPGERRLVVAIERDAGPPPRAGGPAALLVGPEGGFGPRDRALLGRHDFVQPVSLGRRILRADTAAIVGLALLQAPSCG